MKKILSTLLISSAILVVTGCATENTATKTTSSVNASTTSNTATSSTGMTQLSTDETTKYGTYDEEDFDTGYDEATSTKIQLDGTSATIEGDGANVKKGTVTISSAGTYVLSGNFSGQILVSATNQDKIHLILNGVKIKNEGSALYIEQADKTIVTLAAGTTNTLTDSTNYTFATGENEPDATLFSKDDLTLNGTGTLGVTGNYKNGIRGKDDVIITGGTYNITAKNTAIKAKDGLSIAAGNFDLTTSEGDGLQTNNSTDTDKGWIAIDGGTFKIDAGRDGIQAETNLSIRTATMTIKTAAGATSTDLDTEESYKGLKAGKAMHVDDGNFTINSADDAMHSNDTITIDGGTWTLATGDDGIHADNELTLNDGDITVSHSYEGYESAVITFNGGTHVIYSFDDGVNAGGGSDTAEETGMFGSDSFGGSESGPGGGDQADDSKKIIINDGAITIHAEGDGLDSNGNIAMTGGTVYVDGPSGGGNGSLDYNGDFLQNGGVLIATGTADMAQTTSTDSKQKGLALYLDNTQQETVAFQIGDTIYGVSPEKSFAFLFISTPEMNDTNSVTITLGGEISDTKNIATDASAGDTKLGTYDLADTITSVDQSGNAVSGNQMGMSITPDNGGR